MGEGKKFVMSKINLVPDVPIHTASSWLLNINWSVRQYEYLRLELLKFNFHLPLKNDLIAYNASLLPKEGENYLIIFLNTVCSQHLKPKNCVYSSMVITFRSCKKYKIYESKIFNIA